MASLAPSPLKFRQAGARDAPALSALVCRNILPATLPGWTAIAIARLFDESAPDALRAGVASATFACVCEASRSIVGFIACESPRIISLVVVDPSLHRSGIGSRLLAQALGYVAATAPEVSVVEVNATEYSMPFYRRHSFYPISEVIEFSGRRLVRMALWRRNPSLRLPGPAATS